MREDLTYRMMVKEKPTEQRGYTPGRALNIEGFTQKCGGTEYIYMEVTGRGGVSMSTVIGG